MIFCTVPLLSDFNFSIVLDRLVVVFSILEAAASNLSKMWLRVPLVSDGLSLIMDMMLDADIQSERSVSKIERDHMASSSVLGIL